MKITKSELRRIIREAHQQQLEENFLKDLAVGAWDKVSDFFTGNQSIRGKDPAKAEAELEKAMLVFIATEMQETKNSMGNPSQADYDKATRKAEAKIKQILARAVQGS